MIRPILSVEEVKYFFVKFKDGDANDHAYRSALIDTFINKIYLYDGDDPRVEIYCNANEQPINTSFEMLSCAKDEHSKRSSLAQLAQHPRNEPAPAHAPGSCTSTYILRLISIAVLRHKPFFVHKLHAAAVDWNSVEPCAAVRAVVAIIRDKI